MWDVASLFRLAVAFTIGVAGAGGDHAGAGAFLDDVVDHVLLSISVVSAHPPGLGRPICAYCITGLGRAAIGGLLFLGIVCCTPSGLLSFGGA